MNNICIPPYIPPVNLSRVPKPIVSDRDKPGIPLSVGTPVEKCASDVDRPRIINKSPKNDDIITFENKIITKPEKLITPLKPVTSAKPVTPVKRIKSRSVAKTLDQVLLPQSETSISAKDQSMPKGGTPKNLIRKVNRRISLKKKRTDSTVNVKALGRPYKLPSQESIPAHEVAKAPLNDADKQREQQTWRSAHLKTMEFYKNSKTKLPTESVEDNDVIYSNAKLASNENIITNYARVSSKAMRSKSTKSNFGFFDNSEEKIDKTTKQNSNPEIKDKKGIL
jgi:hypothetical protein